MPRLLALALAAPTGNAGTLRSDDFAPIVPPVRKVRQGGGRSLNPPTGGAPSQVDGAATVRLSEDRETAAERKRTMPEIQPLKAFWQPG
jgi:hypothetical protein